MDPRLEDAAHAGDVIGLKRLLQQDRLLLHRINTSLHPADNPIHIAASLGHSQFAREIIEWNPELARAVNGQGLSPLHLASAHGHLSVVKELLSKVGPDLCLLRNKDGLLPIHAAVINGRIQVLEVLLNVSAESIHVRTSSLDNILHLAVKFNCFDVLRYLVDVLEQAGDTDFLMSKDANGNTILHLATARRQLQVVKLLVSKKWANVNDTNTKGSTVLDVLLESPCEQGDLVLGEMIHAAGGKTSAKRDDDESHGTFNDPKDDGNHAWLRMLVLFLKYPLVSAGLGYLVGVEESDYDAYYKNAPESLIVVATLIATITFQGGLNPPGGFVTKGDEDKKRYSGDQYVAGTAVLAHSLNNYIIFDMVALMASLSVILLLVCLVPRKKGPIKFMMWMTWISVFFVGLAFDQAVFLIFPYTVDDFYFVWLVIVSFYTIMLCLRFIVYILTGVGWMKDNRTARARAYFLEGEKPFVRRIGACLAIALAVCAASGVIFFVVRFGLTDKAHDFTDLLP